MSSPLSRLPLRPPPDVIAPCWAGYVARADSPPQPAVRRSAWGMDCRSWPQLWAFEPRPIWLPPAWVQVSVSRTVPALRPAPASAPASSSTQRRAWPQYRAWVRPSPSAALLRLPASPPFAALVPVSRPPSVLRPALLLLAVRLPAVSLPRLA